MPSRACAGTGSASCDQLAALYSSLTVRELLRLCEDLNTRWDAAAAWGRIEAIGLAPQRRFGTLSGGQQAQIALALGKQPDLLLLDVRRGVERGCRRACRGPVLDVADYTTWRLYEPGSRFWAFQAVDAAWLLTLAAVLVLAALWWLRRRPT